MIMFGLACLLVIGAALVLEATSSEGVQAVPIWTWLRDLGALGIWLLTLAAY